MQAAEFKRWVQAQANKDTGQYAPLQEGKNVKRCPKCGELKPIYIFTWASGLGFFCKDCSTKARNAMTKHLQRHK